MKRAGRYFAFLLWRKLRIPFYMNFQCFQVKRREIWNPRNLRLSGEGGGDFEVSGFLAGYYSRYRFSSIMLTWKINDIFTTRFFRLEREITFDVHLIEFGKRNAVVVTLLRSYKTWPSAIIKAAVPDSGTGQAVFLSWGERAVEMISRRMSH